MTYKQICELVDDVKFRNYLFHVSDDGTHFFLYATFNAPCIVSGEEEAQVTREWLISDGMTASDIVTTALKCVLTSIEHEAREDFIWRGERIFGPHLDIEQLHALAISNQQPTN